MLHMEALTKIYRDDTIANDHIELVIAPGEVFGLLGPNGAGKTTLVNQLIGLTAPTSGRIVLDGHDLTANPAAARRACSVQPQTQVPIRGLAPIEFLEIIGRIRGGQRRQVRTRAGHLLEALDLEPWAHKQAAVLSGGVLRLVAFCAAAVVPGQVVVLDEPTNDVDPIRRRLLWDQIRQLADDGAAVVLVTHNVAEVERAADRVAFIHHGRVVAEGTPQQLRRQLASRLRLEAVGAGRDELASPPFPHAVTGGGTRLLVDIDVADTEVVVQWALAQHAAGTIEEFSLSPTTLEDVYAYLLGEESSPRTPESTDA
jgi:ABC-2 type transport system ATP-binding protein